MKKKLIALLAVLAIAAGIIFAIKKSLPSTDPTEGKKSITLIIQDRTSGETVELLNKTFTTDSEYLLGLLEENADELKANISTSADYSSLNGMLDLVTEDWKVGPWWCYESENNECCKLQGYCPSIDQCTIADGDTFIFYFMTY